MMPLWSLTQMKKKSRKRLHLLHPLTMRKDTPAAYEYQPKSPVYPPPSDSSEEEDFSSIPDLATPAEEMSPVPDQLNDSGYGTQNTAPADVNADQDRFPGQGQTEDTSPSLGR